MEHALLVHWFWLTPLGFTALCLGSPRFLGTQATNRLRKILLASLDSRGYTQLHDLHLAVGGHVEHYDHLVFSKSGVYVIDALYLPGEIKGNRVQAWWLRKSWGRRIKFDNPVQASYLRMLALQQALNLPLVSLHSFVAISGYSTLQTDAKDVVIDVQKVPGKILSQSRQLLSAEELDAAVLRIQQIRIHAPLFGSTRRWKLLQLLLSILFIGGIFAVYQSQIMHLYGSVVQAVQSEEVRKTDQQRWEDRLICSYSLDTGRCACYELDGAKASIAPERCIALAERGSVLQQ